MKLKVLYTAYTADVEHFQCPTEAIDTGDVRSGAGFDDANITH